MSTPPSTLPTKTTRRAQVMQLLARVFRFFSPAREAPAIDASKVRRILWIRLDHIGDVAMSLPSLQFLREQFPHAQLDVVVRPGCLPLFQDLALAGRVLTYDTPRFPQKGRGAGFFRTLAFMHRLRRTRYDLAIEPRGDDIARFLCWGSRAPLRLGPDRIFYEAPGAANFRFLMTNVAEVPAAPRHAVEANYALLQPLLEEDGSTAEDPQPPTFRFPLPAERRLRIEELLQSRKVSSHFAVIHACSNDDERNWTPQKWAQVADVIVERYDLDVVLSGIPRDKETNQSIKKLAQHSARLHDFSGAVALPDLATFFSQSRLLVTVDTGPMHIAAFSGTPVVALFLPHLALRHAPWKQTDSVVLPPQNEVQPSLKDIEVDHVLAAIEQKQSELQTSGQ